MEILFQIFYGGFILEIMKWQKVIEEASSAGSDTTLIDSFTVSYILSILNMIWWEPLKKKDT